MAVRLNPRSYEHAQKLIKNRECILDERGAWSEHWPLRHMAKKLIEERGIVEFRKWHLGEDEEIEERSKSRYKFPYGDFRKVHRCAVLSAESRAGHYIISTRISSLLRRICTACWTNCWHRRSRRAGSQPLWIRQKKRTFDTRHGGSCPILYLRPSHEEELSVCDPTCQAGDRRDARATNALSSKRECVFLGDRRYFAGVAETHQDVRSP
jgi:hypothetical protein